jgi:hypothetical protein
MEADKILKEMRDAEKKLRDEHKAGTGFMATLTDMIKKWQDRGFTANLCIKYDHFEVDSGKHKLYPNEIEVLKIERFENTSDPDDQSILYAITCDAKNIKGIYIESYGLYHEDISKEMLDRLKAHPH